MSLVWKIVCLKFKVCIEISTRGDPVDEFDRHLMLK